MDVLNAILKRRSIREYNGQSIPDAVLAQVILAGIMSESSRGRQPWEFVVVREKEKLESLSECREAGAGMLKNADAAIVVFGDESKTDVWIEDCSIAMANMHLAADSLGLGSCWIQGRLRERTDGTSAEDYVRELLGVPENLKLEAILSLGMIDGHPEGRPIDPELFMKVHYDKF